MADIRVVYSDRWGDILDRASEDCLEIRWFDTSASMETGDFNVFLTRYAEHVEAWRRSSGLIDAVQFKMDPAKMDRAWRDENIIPRYNGAGIRKFAFVMPMGMPAIGARPAPEGPARFPTAYFGARADALAWIAS